MAGDQSEYYSLGHILVRTRAFILFVIRKWIWVLLGVIIGGVAGLGIQAMQKPKYEASCTFILEEKQSGLGGLGGIASQFGIDIGGLTGGSGMFAGDNMLDVLSSQRILKQILLTKTDSLNSKKTLADRYADFTGLRAIWNAKPKLAAINFEQARTIADLNRLQDSLLNIVYESVIKKNLSAGRTNKKSTIFNVSVVSIDAEFSKELAYRLVRGAKDFYITAKTSTITANINRLQHKADSLAVLLTGSSYRAAQAQVNDPNPALRALQVPTEIAVRDKTVLATLYTEVIKNLEMAKTTLMIQTPVLEILDTPSLSVYDNKKGRLFFTAIGAFIMVSLVIFFLLIKFNSVSGNRTK